MQKKILFLILLTLLFFISCQSQKAVTQEKVYDQQDFLKEAAELLSLPNPDFFLAHYNKYQSQFPEAIPKVRFMLASQLFSQLKRQVEANNYAAAELSLRSVFSLPEAKALLTPELIRAYRNLKSESEGEYSRLLDSEAFKNQQAPEIKASQNWLSAYSERLVKIEVDLVYTDSKTQLTKFSSSSGSGLILNSGTILTVFHLFEDNFKQNVQSYTIRVRTKGDMHEAEIHAWDVLHDLAILKLKSSLSESDSKLNLNLWGNSDKLRQGDSVYAFGNHNGMDKTLSKGIISSLSRETFEKGEWLQVDAVIIGGASGGILIGEDGKIYGILVAGHYNKDLNFVIPSNKILERLDRLIDGQVINYPWLGLRLDMKDDGSATSKNGFRIQKAYGASALLPYVSDEHHYYLAALNGKTLSNQSQLDRFTERFKPGSIVEVTVIHKPSSKVVVTNKYLSDLGTRPSKAMYNMSKWDETLTDLDTYFGFKVKSSDLNRSVNLDGETYSFNLYSLSYMAVDSPLIAKGFKVGDKLGFLDDYYLGQDRVLLLMHFPDNYKPFYSEHYVHKLYISAYDKRVY